MADLSIEFCGIKSINPFWLASAPPTDKAYNVVRAFEAGWGGVVWKTLGEDPAAVNVSSRYSAHYGKNREVLGFNNIELITDRSLAINLQEITQVKKDWPDRVIIVSLIPNTLVAYWAFIGLWGFIAIAIIDMVFLGIRVNRRIAEKFGKDKRERGLAWYAAMRSLQMRFMRLPKPQVKRGEYPA